MSSIPLAPVAHVTHGRRDPIDDHWAEVISIIELAPEFSPDALLGLDSFSHIEVIFHLHLVLDHTIERVARHPRNNPAYPKVGIFAQRGKNRPNCLGVSIAKLVKIEGRQITVTGLDAIEGTPILDIKPVFKEFLPRDEIRQPDWSRDLMKSYWE